METITLALMIDPADAGFHTHNLSDLEPAQRAALVRERLLEILEEEDDTELATRLAVKSERCASCGRPRNEHHLGHQFEEAR